ncbi:MAG: hypothetical protein V4792_16560 [Pseudomonadota bacterium]
MDAAFLIRKLQEQREEWCELGDGLRVCFVRPPETEVHSLVRGVGVEHARKYVVKWDGFTEVTVLGEGVGASDPLDFNADLWAALVADRADWLSKFADALVSACNRRHKERKAALGNSAPTSEPA